MATLLCGQGDPGSANCWTISVLGCTLANPDQRLQTSVWLEASLDSSLACFPATPAFPLHALQTPASCRLTPVSLPFTPRLQSLPALAECDFHSRELSPSYLQSARHYWQFFLSTQHCAAAGYSEHSYLYHGTGLGGGAGEWNGRTVAEEILNEV